MILQKFRDQNGVVFLHIQVLQLSLPQIRLIGKYSLPLVPKAIRVILEIQVLLVLKVILARLVLPDLLVQPALMALQGP